MYIWGVRARQHLRSLAPVMNYYGCQWWPNDIRGPWDLKLPDICLAGEEKPRKNLSQETCPDRESNPGPLRDRRACYHLTHAVDETSLRRYGSKLVYHITLYFIFTLLTVTCKYSILTQLTYHFTSYNSCSNWRPPTSKQAWHRRTRFYRTLTNIVHHCGTSSSMRACHAAGLGSIPVGTSFLGEVFSGFFLTCKTNVRKLWAHKVPEYHLAIIIIHHHFITASMTLDVDAPLKLNIHTYTHTWQISLVWFE